MTEQVRYARGGSPAPLVSRRDREKARRSGYQRRVEPGTIIGGFRVVSWYGWDSARRTLYLSECLGCGERLPRSTWNMQRTRGCNSCAFWRRVGEPRPKSPHPGAVRKRKSPVRHETPGTDWPGWPARCQAVAEKLSEPLEPALFLRLIRQTAATMRECHAARQWLAAGEALGFWHWQAGVWWRTRS